MILGIGMDLCEIGRMEKELEREAFLTRFFSPEERAYIRSRGRMAAQSMAGIFAAKEALGKALGGGLDFDLREASISHDDQGAPFYHLTGSLGDRTKGERFFLSISHEGDYAAACCVRERGEL